jgi:hypothetical protein
VIWVGAEQENFFLWDSTAPITPNLARRAVVFLHDVIRHRGGKREFGTSGSGVARMERSEIRESRDAGPGFRGACHRARIRANRWLHPGYDIALFLAGDRRTTLSLSQ